MPAKKTTPKKPLRNPAKMPAARRPLSGAALKAHATKKATPARKAAPVKRAPTKAVKATPAKRTIPPARAAASDKAAAFADYARENGWWAEAKVDKDSGATAVICKRDDGRYKETIEATWVGDRVTRGGVVLQIVGGRTILLRNVSAARKHIDGSKTVKREVNKRAKRVHRVTRQIIVNRETGQVMIDDEVDDVTPKHEIIGANIVDKRYHIHVTRPVKVKGKTVHETYFNTGPVLSNRLDSFKRYEEEGMTVHTREHVPGDCDLCATTAAGIAALKTEGTWPIRSEPIVWPPHESSSTYPWTTTSKTVTKPTEKEEKRTRKAPGKRTATKRPVNKATTRKPRGGVK